MEEEKKSILEQLEEQRNEATRKVNDTKAAWDTQRGEVTSARQAMLVEPQIDTTKVNNTRKMGKVQAWTDFLSALTSGVIGAASKGYAPQVGANAQPYAVSLENMHELNKQRIENYNKLKKQTDIALAENDLRFAQSEYERALAEEKEAKNAIQRQREIEEGRQHEEEMLNKRIEASQIGNQKPPKTNIREIGGIPVDFTGIDVRGMYYALINNGVEGVMEEQKDEFGSKSVSKKNPSDLEILNWVYQNPDAVLYYLRNGKPKQKTTTQETRYETATPTGGYFTPNYNKDKKEQEKPNNSPFNAPNGFTHFKWQ